MIDSGRVRAAICPTRGMGLWRATIDDCSYGWNSPVPGPVHPAYVSMDDPIGWLDGFDELLVRCGMRSFGAPDFDETGKLLYPLHGRVANLPARDVTIEIDVEHSLLKLSGMVTEARFLQFKLELKATYIFHLDQPTIEVVDEVTNKSSQPAGVQMLYHINVGEPTLSAGAKMHLAADRIVARNERAANDLSSWDTYQGPTPGYEEQVYFSASKPDNDGWANALLSDASGETGFGVRYDTSTLPYFTQWKNTVASEDGYVTGLEPGTGFPNPRSFEAQNGRVVELAGGESLTFQLQLEGIQDKERLTKLTQQIGSQGGSPKLDEFDEKWCVPR